MEECQPFDDEVVVYKIGGKWFAELSDEMVKREIRHSYFCVIKNGVVPKSKRNELLALAAEAGVADDAELFY